MSGFQFASIYVAFKPRRMPKGINPLLIDAFVKASPASIMISESRITAGEAVWTKNFTPPTEEYTCVGASGNV